MTTTFSQSHSYGFLYLGGGVKCLVYETPIDTPEELVARVAEAAAIIRETQSSARRYQLCINVTDDIFNNFCKTILHQILQGPLVSKQRLSVICHITKGFRFISSTNPQSLYMEFFFTLCINRDTYPLM